MEDPPVLMPPPTDIRLPPMEARPKKMERGRLCAETAEAKDFRNDVNVNGAAEASPACAPDDSAPLLPLNSAVYGEAIKILGSAPMGY